MSNPGWDVEYWGPNGPDISRWKGPTLSRGMRYADLGSTVDGQKGAVRKISTGRKAHRGSASDDFDKAEERRKESK